MSPSHKRIAKKQTRPAHKRHPKGSNTPRHPFETTTPDSSEQGRHTFQWLLDPIPLQTFFDDHFETKPLHLRNDSNKFSCLASVQQIRHFIKRGKLSYGLLDVTSYDVSTGRATHNLDGVAALEVWQKFSAGCSLRLRRPQSHFTAIRDLCAHLESFLQCVVGANIYLTPANSQGFAPHFDDVEALILQVSGVKHWKVYKRDDDHDVLPRRSSVDFTKADVKRMKPVMDVVLRPGDVLYLPRGAVHEASCDQVDSLHVTISFCQRWTWADLLLGSFERAVLETAAVDTRLRESLPLRFGNLAGAAVDGGAIGKRFGNKLRSMLNLVAKNYPVDYAVDTMMERFVKERLPITGNGKQVVSGCRVKLLASCCVRLVVGDDGLPVLVTKDDRQSCLPEEAACIKLIVDRYPKGVKVEDIPLERTDDRLELARGLVEMGVLEVV